MKRVEFDYRPADPKTQYDMAGWLLLDPSRSLAIVEYEVTRKIPGLPPKDRVTRTITGTLRYGEESDLRSIPVEVKSRSVGATEIGRTLTVEETAVADAIEPKAPPARDFRLFGYGLGDLESPAPKSSGVAWWAFGIGAVALALSALLHRLGARARVA